MIRAILVDDEESAITWLGELLSAHGDVEVVGTAGSVLEAVALLDFRRPDVVFLDISMPRRSGMELFDAAGADVRIVLVTAHDDRALQAFESGAFDYLLKPVTPARLGKTIDRLRHALRQPAPPTPPPDAGDRIAVVTPTGTTILPFDQMIWIEARQNYSLIRRRRQHPAREAAARGFRRRPSRIAIRPHRQIARHQSRGAPRDRPGRGQRRRAAVRELRTNARRRQGGHGTTPPVDWARRRRAEPRGRVDDSSARSPPRRPWP